MRAILLILILAIAALIVAVATGFIDIDQTRGAQAPTVGANENGVTAQGGQTPAFDVETGSVSIGTSEANVALPKVTVESQPRTVQVPSIEVKQPPANQNQAAPRS